MSELSDQKLLWQTVGHTGPKNFLQSALQAGQLSHGYLFLGPTNTGKTTLAKDFARMLLCSEKSMQLPCGKCHACILDTTNPDFLIIDEPGEIKIEKIRKFKEQFSYKSFSGRYRVAVIAQAQNLSLEAANALLKFLEEPDASTVIVLTAPTSAALPATIVSRLTRLYFGQATLSDFEYLTGFNKIGEVEKAKMVDLAFGRPGLVARFLSEPEFYESWQKRVSDLHRLMSADMSEQLSFAAETAELETEELADLFFSWLLALNHELDQLKFEAGIASAAEAASQALINIRANLNKRLVLDNLMLSFNK